MMYPDTIEYATPSGYLRTAQVDWDLGEDDFGRVQLIVIVMAINGYDEDGIEEPVEFTDEEEEWAMEAALELAEEYDAMEREP